MEVPLHRPSDLAICEGIVIIVTSCQLLTGDAGVHGPEGVWPRRIQSRDPPASPLREKPKSCDKQY